MNEVKLSDEELWQLVRDGQESAFTQLMTRFLPALIHYGRKFSSDPDLVEDCVQDVLADLWMRRTSVSPILSVGAYLYAAVRNHVCRQDRKTLRTDLLSDEAGFAPFDATFSVEDQLIAHESEKERLGKLSSLVNQLPPRQKEIIYLRYFKGMNKEEIAEILDINYQSVSNLLHRTLTSLRRQFSVLVPVFLAFLCC